MMTYACISVLLIVGPKCTVAASHALVSHGEYVDRTDRQTNGRTPDRYITLCDNGCGQRNNLTYNAHDVDKISNWRLKTMSDQREHRPT